MIKFKVRVGKPCGLPGSENDTRIKTEKNLCALKDFVTQSAASFLTELCYTESQALTVLREIFAGLIFCDFTTIWDKIVAKKVTPYGKIIPYSPMTMLKHEIVFLVI